ncbi:MAG: AAA family ATPase [Clostridiales bacterium]|nr:AAA family ATPase [Clostridiales bacterium]
MPEPITISQLQIENVKRVKALKLTPDSAGLTVVGGKNNQGKTSVLDAIAWTLGGNKYKPSNPKNDQSVIPPFLHLELSNGLRIERTGANSTLKVIDPKGNKAGQTLLDEFINYLALDLPKFMAATNKEKALILLQILGIGDKLHQLEQQESQLYNQRHAIGQIADQKKKFAAEMPDYPDVPEFLVSAMELIQQQQEILAINGENQHKRDNLSSLQAKARKIQQDINQLLEQQKAILVDLEIAQKSALDLQDQSTTELEQNINQIEDINVKVRANLDKAKAEDDAHEYKGQYDTLTTQIEDVRKARLGLLQGAKLPLPGLSIEDSELVYNGHKWDCMSSSEQLKVAVAIVRQTKPECGFVLLDKLEQMDLDTLREFGSWLESEGLQAIATRVSTGEECHLIIEDGYAVNQAVAIPPKFKEGEF